MPSVALRLRYALIIKETQSRPYAGPWGPDMSPLRSMLHSLSGSGVSRVLLAQLTRHRLASFSVQSQRYVNQANAFSTIPPTIKANPAAYAAVGMRFHQNFDLYDDLVNMGIPEEDARYVLHQGVCTALVMTMNIRELKHFLELRMCNRAQWEIRELADRIFKIAYPIAPDSLANAGPGCVRGLCPEGKKCCGKPRSGEITKMATEAIKEAAE